MIAHEPPEHRVASLPPRADWEAAMTLDVPFLRSDTSGASNIRHFNNAGSALPPRPVVEAVMSHLARAVWDRLLFRSAHVQLPVRQAGAPPPHGGADQAD